MDISVSLSFIQQAMCSLLLDFGNSYPPINFRQTRNPGSLSTKLVDKSVSNHTATTSFTNLHGSDL